MTIQHLRSSTANKRPTPAVMSDGQIAVNTNTASPGLFFKDSAGALIKVGPVHVGTTAPNASPASGGETGNTVGEQWLDTAGGTYVFKVWDGSAWRSETGTFVDVNGDVMTGALGIIAGSAGSPGLYFSGDTNTGLYSPGSDQLALATGGTGRLFIDSNGRLGVGTGSPDANLDIVRGSSGTVATFGIEGLTANPRLRIDVDETNNTVTFNPNYSGATSPSLVFNTQEAERLRITSAGLVGIGSSSPSYLLDCKSTGATNVARFLTGSTTSSEVAQFGRIDQAVNLSIDYDGAGSMGIGTTTAHPFNLKTGAVTRATIDTSGRLLVGTSSDSGGALFQVNGDRIRVGTAKTPASAAATGTAGEICWDASYVYVCTATNTWKRSALSTW